MAPSHVVFEIFIVEKMTLKSCPRSLTEPTRKDPPPMTSC